MKFSSHAHDANTHASKLAVELSCLGGHDLGLTRRLATLMSLVVILVVIIIDPGGVR